MKNIEQARVAARDVIEVLSDRARFNHWWDDIPTEIKEEIIDDIANVLLNGL